MQSIRVIKVENQQDLEKAWAIRIRVFVEEQQVDRSLEYDHEEESHHFLAFVGEIPVGTARWRKTEKGIKLERFAVLPEYRNQGVASALLNAVLSDAGKGEKIYLHAQEGALDFYRRHGFVAEGDMFEEAGIRHFRMILPTKTGYD